MKVATMATTIDRRHTLVVGMSIAMLVLGLRIGILVQAQRHPVDAGGTAPTVASAEAPWAPHLHAVEEALAQQNVSRAVHAWRDAYGAALGSRRWDGALAVGDAYLKIGDAGNFRRSAEATARRSYLAALMLARHAESLDGVLRAGAAFQGLGDRDVVEQAASIAVAMAPDLTRGAVRSRIRELAQGIEERPATHAAASPRS